MLPLSNNVAKLEEKFTALKHQFNLFDKLEEMRAEIVNGNPSSGQENKTATMAPNNLKGGQAPGSSPADKPVAAPKSTANSGTPVSPAKSGGNAYRNRIAKMLEESRNEQTKIAAIWNEKINNLKNGGHEREQVGNVFESLQANVQTLISRLEQDLQALPKEPGEKTMNELPRHLSSVDASEKSLMAHKKSLENLKIAVLKLDQDCTRLMQGNAIKKEKREEEPTRAPKKIDASDTPPLKKKETILPLEGTGKRS